jgi:DNA-binding CsgD family transcriptional regulator
MYKMPMDTHARLQGWHHILASIFSHPSPDSVSTLLRGLETLVDGCNSMAIIYPKGATPQVTHHRLLANEDPKLQVDSYTDGAYLLDPFYRKTLKDYKEGIYTLAQAAPEGFEASEYFNLYYRQSNLKDEVCFLFPLNDRATASISIGRSESLNRSLFSSEELSLLDSTFELVKTVFVQLIEPNSSIPATLESHLDNALENFGTSVLTPKECEILQLILQGNSIKAVADKLNNSQETIKHHRKKIYTKLDVTSQAELFHLLISSLRYISNTSTDIDPLQAYCSAH